MASDEETASARVLEYYRAHAQNKQLPKYFCGTYDFGCPSVENQRNIPEVIVEEVADTSRVPSPASSVASNRKLEWDNGADIGYENCNRVPMKKSHSLPTLSSQTDCVKVHSDGETKSARVEEHSPREHVLSFLRAKVGDPIAESTPAVADVRKVEDLISATPKGRKHSIESVDVPPLVGLHDDTFSEKPEQDVVEELKKNLIVSHFSYELQGNQSDELNVSSVIKSMSSGSSNVNDNTLRKWRSEFDLTLTQRVKYFNRYRNRKLKNLATSQPMCLEIIARTNSTDKDIQTCSENVSVGVQTDSRRASSGSSKNSGVLYMSHVYKDDTESTATPKSNSDVVFSNCNSFEFHYGSDVGKQSRNKSSSTSLENDRLPMQRNAIKTGLTSSSTTVSNKSSSLSELLTIKQSDKLIPDIEQSLTMLQKLMKSKRYDEKTKERYVQKIVKKILTSNYNDDSSVSSQQITPNIEPRLKIRAEDDNKSSDSDPMKKLQSNVPWIPADPKSLKLKDDKFTIPPLKYGESSTECSTGYNQAPDFLLPTEEKANCDWRNEKTVSEQLLERRLSSQGGGDSPENCKDHMVNFAKRERQNQLTWINNEIKHLGKLKNLLESKDRYDCLYSKPRLEDMPKTNKSTAVYVINTEKKEYKCAKDCPKNVSKVHLRYYRSRCDLNDAKYEGEDEFEVEPRSRSGSPGCSCSGKKGVAFNYRRSHRDKDCTPPDVDEADDYKKKRPHTAGNKNREHKSTKKDNSAGSSRKSSGRKTPEQQKRNDSDSSDGRPLSKDHKHRSNQREYFINHKRRRSHDGEMVDEIDFEISGCSDACSKYNDGSDTASDKSEKARSRSKSSDRAKKHSKSPPASPKRQHRGGKEEVKIVEQAKTSKSVSDHSLEREPDVLRKGTSGTFKFQNARVVSSKIKSSSNNPKENVRRVILEVPVGATIKEGDDTDSVTEKVEPILNKASTTSQSSVTSNASSLAPLPSDNFVLCSCCRKKISDDVASSGQTTGQTSGQAYSRSNLNFCRPCYDTSGNYSYNPLYYNRPNHKCTCYSVIDNRTMEEVRNTLQQLQEMDESMYCKCRDSDKGASGVCPMCSCRVNGGDGAKDNKSVAYMLTFQQRKEKPVEVVKKPSPLEKVTVKVPPSPVEKKSAGEKKKSPKKAKPQKKETKTLQQYLERNRPNFIEAAEDRRKCMIELAYMREKRCQKYKQLLAMTNETCLPNNRGYADMQPKRIFTTKEMKLLTEKNYKKLPEVQQKLLETRDRQIKKANRLLADIFNKNLRDNVLRGRHTLSTSISVINLA